MDIGEEIKKLRQKSQLTQNKLAQQVGTTQHCISQIEKGTKEPGRRLFAAIIDTFSSNDLTDKLDFINIISSVIQYFIPGSKCHTFKESRSDFPADIVVELPTGLKTQLNIQTNPIRAHDPIILSIIQDASEDLIYRNALKALTSNTELKNFIIEVNSNGVLKRIFSKIMVLRDNPTQLDFFESFLDTVVQKQKNLS